MNNNFANNLRFLRKLNHLKQKDVANIVGKSDDIVSCWEKETRKPLVEDVYALSQYFHVDMETLYFGDVTNVKAVR